MSEEQRLRPRGGERKDEYTARLIVETNSCYELTVLDQNSGVRLVDYTTQLRQSLEGKHQRAYL